MSGWSIAAIVGFALLGALSVFLLLVHSRAERALNSRGVRVPGRVTERLRGAGAGFHSAVEFHVDGVARRIKSEQSTGHSVGDSVVVIYLPDRPQEARIDGVMERWHGTIGSVVFLVIAVAGAITMVALGTCGVF
jgi:hypothetical protein